MVHFKCQVMQRDIFASNSRGDFLTGELHVQVSISIRCLNRCNSFVFPNSFVVYYNLTGGIEIWSDQKLEKPSTRENLIFYEVALIPTITNIWWALLHTKVFILSSNKSRQVANNVICAITYLYFLLFINFRYFAIHYTLAINRNFQAHQNLMPIFWSI